MILGRQEWEHLLFVHYEVEEAALRREVPDALELDRHEERSWVTIIPFRIRRSRPAFLPRAAAPILPASAFVELNFRTYVRGPDGEAGVFFFSLDASSLLAVAAGRAVYRLPYVHARMELTVDDGAIRFSSARISGPEECEARYRPAGTPAPAAPGTLDHFLIERYALFAVDGTKVSAARVRHHPYRVQSVSLETWRENLLVGRGFAPAPFSAIHYAAALPVEVSSPFRAG
ncbi:MAG TPA: DUF2071 domain-containing protein [Thermoanaerobaculia bacterium]|nr:DUF2071 domain-containing protein [Thermoanaerobaculia bacterium]